MRMEHMLSYNKFKRTPFLSDRTAMLHITPHTYAAYYQRISAFWRIGNRARILSVLDHVLVTLFVIAFVAMCAWLIYTSDPRCVQCIGVPACIYILVSVLHTIISAPRPYEAFDIDPLIHKDKQRASFPSRHVSSAGIIACALGYIYMPLGIMAWIATCVLAYARVVEGVHFPRDVITAVAISAFAGYIGFVLV